MRTVPFLFLCVLMAGCGLVPGLGTPAPTPPTQPSVRVTIGTAQPGVPLAESTGTTAPTSSPLPLATATAGKTQVLPTAAASQPAAKPLTAVASFELAHLPGQGRAPGSVAVAGNTVYVGNNETNNIAVVSGGAVKAYIAMPGPVGALAASASPNRIYAATNETQTISIIENDRVTKTVRPGGTINALAADRNYLYAARDDHAVIERYDANTLEKKGELQLTQGYGVGDLALDGGHNRLYALTYGKLGAIDLAAFQELHWMDAPGAYRGVAVNPKDGSVWTAGYDSDSSKSFVVGYDTGGSQLAKLSVGEDLIPQVIDNAGRLWVLDSYQNTVYVIQTPEAQLVGSVAVNEAPRAAALDASRNQVVVANHDSNNLSVIDAGTLKETALVPLATDITAMAANPVTGRVFVANGALNSVYMIDGDKVVGQAVVGSNPLDLAVDSTTNRVYVANHGDGAVTMLDGDSLQILASEVITPGLSTVAVDPMHKRLFAGGSELDPQSLKPIAAYAAKGITLGSATMPLLERVNPGVQQLYAAASNGVPGSNSRLTLYRFLYEDLANSKYLGTKNGGNVSAIAVDMTTNRVYVPTFHPLAYTYGLDVWDGSDNLVQSLPMPAGMADAAVNPATHHLFLAQTQLFGTSYTTPENNNTVGVLDTRTLGTVANIPVNDPWRLAVLQDRVYVGARGDGTITILQDGATTQPPAPTPTLTPTPYPTSAATSIVPQGTAAAPVTSTPAPSVACSFGPPAPFAENWVGAESELGCPTGQPTKGSFAVQTFRDGYMFDDLRVPGAYKIYALYPDHTYATFDDTWKEGDVDRPCNDVQIPEGRIHPQRGFGKVWCEHPGVQAQLPGAVAREALADLQVQTFEHGVMWANTPQGVITLLSNGTWK